MTRTLFRLSLAAGALALAACGGDDLKGFGSDGAGLDTTATACAEDLDCDFGDACIKGTCQARCTLDDSCDDPTVDPPADDPTADNPVDDPPVDDPPVDDPPVDDPPVDDPPVDDPPPDDPYEPLPLHVGGLWDTTYHLDWSAYMGPLANLGTPLDVLDQVLLNNINIPFIDAIIDNYVPAWVGKVVHVLNNMVHFFQDVRIDARMDLTHVIGDPHTITGLEMWDRATVQVIDQCPLGEMDPGYPACAELPLPLNFAQTGIGTISAIAQPFTGWVGDVGGGVHQVQIDQRQVQMELGEFILWVVNSAVNIASNGQFPTLGSALGSLVDCMGLQSSLEGFVGSPLPWVAGVCQGAVDNAITEVTNSIAAVTIDWEVMEFGQVAVAYDDDGDTSADRLGAPPSQPGSVDGDLQVLWGTGMDGTWFGTRP